MTHLWVPHISLQTHFEGMVGRETISISSSCNDLFWCFTVERNLLETCHACYTREFDVSSQSRRYIMCLIFSSAQCFTTTINVVVRICLSQRQSLPGAKCGHNFSLASKSRKTLLRIDSLYWESANKKLCRASLLCFGVVYLGTFISASVLCCLSVPEFDTLSGTSWCI